ncbi:hypothetical protein E2C01_101845 [Portunus trituberculatus]|uniref:Uncharacterized protein n=1 Tax=Portunus trituberculatus TaxID=210409 RepID=A0A5B7KGV9_PORTR|nr:hypothetical protein [Portunus trituberculatus]
MEKTLYDVAWFRVWRSDIGGANRCAFCDLEFCWAVLPSLPQQVKGKGPLSNVDSVCCW